NVLNGAQAERDIVLNPLPWYARNGITLHAGVKATAIDRQRRVVTGERPDGTRVTEPYDRLILATGSRPYVPPVEGAGQEGIFLFRTVEDCRAIARYAAGCRTAVVIGGGLLGLEAARGLLTHGLEVTIVEVASHLMVQQLDAGGGAALRRTIE